MSASRFGRAWVEAGARVIIKRAVRSGLIARGAANTDVTAVPFDLVLDLARTTYVEEFLLTLAGWRRRAKEMEKHFVDGPYKDEVQKARLLLEQADLAEEAIRDL